MSQASAHGHLQLKHQKLGLDGCMEEMLELFNYPRTSADLRYEVRNRIDLHHFYLVRSRGQPDSVESCIMLESELTRSLVAKLLQCLSLAVYKICIAIEEPCLML